MFQKCQICASGLRIQGFCFWDDVSNSHNEGLVQFLRLVSVDLTLTVAAGSLKTAIDQHCELQAMDKAGI